jgi:hypothetical protein
VPIAGRQFGPKREDDVPEAAGRRHRDQRLAAAEAVAFAVVGAAFEERRQQAGKSAGIHLLIAVHLDQDVRAELERAEIARLHRPAHAAVLLVDHQVDAGVGGGLDLGAGVVGAAVIDEHDGVDEGRDPRDDRSHVGRHIAAGDDDGDLGAGFGHRRLISSG